MVRRVHRKKEVHIRRAAPRHLHTSPAVTRRRSPVAFAQMPSSHSSGSEGVRRCPSCHSAVHAGASFCPHCGARVGRVASLVSHKCAHCNSPLETHSKYCRHCGAPVRSFHHTITRPFLRYLTYVVLFFLLMGVLYFIIPRETFLQGDREDIAPLPPDSVRSPSAGLAAIASDCSWGGDRGSACVTFQWDKQQGDVLQLSLDGSPVGALGENSQSFCQPVLTTGVKEFIGKLFRQGVFVDEGSVSVSCTRPLGTISPSIKSNALAVSKRVQFRAEHTYGRGRGEGSVAVDLGGRVKTCMFQGSMVTNNDEILRPKLYCHGAPISLQGYYDKNTQWVTSDPGLFSWAGPGKGRDDPSPVTYQGYSMYGLLCDPYYFQNPRYYLRAIAQESTNGLLLQWEYYNDETMPAVDVSLDFTCDVFLPGK